MNLALLRALAIHEAGHAVMAGAVTTPMRIKRIWVARDGVREGRCEWTNAPAEHEDAAAAIAFAGPLAQILYAADSLGQPNIFGRTIYYPPAVLNRRGLNGWFGHPYDTGDLRHFVRRDAATGNPIHAVRLPVTPLEQIQERTKALLLRPGPKAAIEALAQELQGKGDLAGPDAEAIILAHLAPDDHLAADYFSAHLAGWTR
jgi:hypothetical protein